MRGLAVLVALALLPGLAAADTVYAVKSPSDPAPQAGSGWGLYATLHGRSMDLNSHSWADDPRVQPRDVEAGYGFRSGMASALIGYDQHDFGPKAPHAIAPGARDPNEPPTVQSGGVLGVSFVLHAR
jgi:hypothetical protein